jgi:hypothetical protein
VSDDEEPSDKHEPGFQKERPLYIEKLTKEQTILILTVCDVMGKSISVKSVEDAFTRSQEKWSDHLVNQVPRQPDHHDRY